MSHIFISYSRKDIDFAQKIVTTLADNKLDTWIDWKSIPKGEDWKQEIYRGIEQADAFLFLLSPDSVTSEMCNKEIAHAVENNKRILPIVIRDANVNDFSYETPKKEISKRNWVFCRDGQDDFNEAIEETQKTIHTDYDWLKYHTKLQVKALDWQRRTDNSRLLRGKELREAEEELTKPGEKDPQPTDLQRQYILESQRGEIRTRNSILAIGALVIVALAFLSIFAFDQRNTAIAKESARATAQADAENQKGIAIANEDSRATAEANAIREAETAKSLAFAANAKNALLNGDPDLAIALALEAVKVNDPPLEATTALREIAFAPGTQRVISGISIGVLHAIFSPDQSLILSGDGEGNVQLWDARTGKEIRQLGAHIYENLTVKPIVVGLGFNLDGQIAISAGGDDVRFWDINTGREIRRVNLIEPTSQPKTAMSTAAFTPDGRLMVWGSVDGSVHLWDLETGTEAFKLGTHNQRVNRVAINSDGTLALSGAAGRSTSLESQTIKLWDLKGGKEIREFSIEGQGIMDVYGVAFSPDNRLIAASTVSGIIQIWDMNSGQEVERLEGSPSVSTLSFSPDGRMIALSGGDRTINVWDVISGKQVHKFRGHTNDVIDSVNFSPGGKEILSGSLDGTIRIWDLSQGGDEFSLIGHTAKLSSLSFSRDGDYLLSSSWDGSLRLWDIERLQETLRIKPDDASLFTRSTISHDGKRILAGTGYSLFLFDAQSGKEIREIQETGGVLALGFITGSNTAYTVGINLASNQTSPEGALRVWDLETGNELDRFFDTGVNSSTLAGVVSPDGRFAALAEMHDLGGYPPEVLGGLSLWDFGNHQRLHIDLDPGLQIWSLAFSPDSDLLLAGGFDNQIHIFDVKTGKKLRILQGHTEVVTSLAIGPDGKNVLSGSLDGTIRIWDLGTGQEIQNLKNDKPVWSVAYNPNGNMIIWGSQDGSIKGQATSRSVDEVVKWVHTHRYVRELTCRERQQYAVEPLCAEGGMIPTQTPITTAQIPETPSNVPLPNSTPTVSSSGFIYTQSVEGVYSNTPQFWSYPADVGDRITITVSSASFDPYLILKGPGGELLSVNDDAEPGISNDAAIRSYLVPKMGIYSIIVDRFVAPIGNRPDMGSGFYNLSLTVESNETIKNDPLHEQEIGLFGISWTTDEQTHDLIVSGMISDGPADKAGLYPGDVVIALNGQKANNISERAVWNILRVPMGTPMRITVMRGGSLSDIQVYALKPVENPLKSLSTHRFSIGQKVVSSLRSGESETWTFEGTAGQFVSTILGGYVSPPVDLILRDPSDQILAEGGDLTSEAGWLLWRWNRLFPLIQLPQTGTYTLTISSKAAPAGTRGYTLLIQEMKYQGDVDSGKTVTGKLSNVEGLFWTFEGSSGQVASVRLQQQQSLLEPFIFLLDLDKNLIAQAGVDGFDKFSSDYDPSANKEIRIPGFLLPSTGTYTVIVSPFVRFNPIPDSLVGSFSLHLDFSQMAPVADIKPGQSINGNLPVGENIYYTLNGKKGQQLTINLNAINPASQAENESYKKAIEMGLLDTFLTIYKPDISVLASNNDYGSEQTATTDSMIEVTLLEDGVYIIEVSSDRNLTGGNYSLNIEAKP